MARIFQGRTVIKGAAEGPAIVSRSGFNAYASFYNSLSEDVQGAVCVDNSNQDTCGKVLSGKILCIPNSIGSTSAGAVWQRLASLGIAPIAVLFANPIDSLAAGGLLVANIWTDGTIYAVDQLGQEFLEVVQDENMITIQEDGSVVISSR